MAQAVVSAILLVLLAVLVAFNVRFTTSLSLFGARFDEVPTMAVALVSFALGVVYSLFLSVSRFLRRKKQQGLERKDKALAQRERELAARESPAPQTPDSPPEIGPSSAGGTADRAPREAPAPKRRGFFGRLKPGR